MVAYLEKLLYFSCDSSFEMSVVSKINNIQNFTSPTSITISIIIAIFASNKLFNFWKWLIVAMPSLETSERLARD